MGSKRAPLFAGIAVGVLAILMIVLLVLPKMNEVTEAQDDLSASEARGVALQSRREALETAQAELARVEAGESTADRWQLEQRIKHAENQLSVSGRTTG